MNSTSRRPSVTGRRKLRRKGIIRSIRVTGLTSGRGSILRQKMEVGMTGTLDEALIITPELLEYWPDEELVNFVLDDEVVKGTPKYDLILIAQELAIRYDQVMSSEEEEDNPDDPPFYHS